jgi:hypothetical protein
VSLRASKNLQSDAENAVVTAEETAATAADTQPIPAQQGKAGQRALQHTELAARPLTLLDGWGWG